jgi:hypothetical protein
MQGVVLLGAEIEWTERTPRVVRATVDWAKVQAAGTGCSIALRVAPFGGPSGENDPALRSIDEVAKSLLVETDVHHVNVDEFQLDFDCAQKNLANYRRWLRHLRTIISPTRFVITTLPSWLGEPDFAALVKEVDGYVLQVHSVQISGATGAGLCDTRAARRWVAQAAQLRLPFSVALPTYRCTAGFNSAGKLIGVAMDSSLAPNTRTLEFNSDADEIATLVNEWEHARPAELRELLWYRIPVTTDARNWRWPTLNAVMAGRKPRRHFEVVEEGGNPVDLSIVNAGESDDVLGTVAALWHGGGLVAVDALAGWNVAQKERALSRCRRATAPACHRGRAQNRLAALRRSRYSEPALSE